MQVEEIELISAMTGKSLRLSFKGDKVRYFLTQPKRKRVKTSNAKQEAFFQDEESDAEMYGGDEQGTCAK